MTVYRCIVVAVGFYCTARLVMHQTRYLAYTTPDLQLSTPFTVNSDPPLSYKILGADGKLVARSFYPHRRLQEEVSQDDEFLPPTEQDDYIIAQYPVMLDRILESIVHDAPSAGATQIDNGHSENSGSYVNVGVVGMTLAIVVLLFGIVWLLCNLKKTLNLLNQQTEEKHITDHESQSANDSAEDDSPYIGEWSIGQVSTMTNSVAEERIREEDLDLEECRDDVEDDTPGMSLLPANLVLGLSKSLDRGPACEDYIRSVFCVVEPEDLDIINLEVAGSTCISTHPSVLSVNATSWSKLLFPRDIILTINDISTAGWSAENVYNTIDGLRSSKPAILKLSVMSHSSAPLVSIPKSTSFEI